MEEPLPFSDDVVKEEKRARAIVERHDALVAAQVNLQATQPDQPDQPGSLPSSSSTGPSAVRSHAESKQLASQQMPKAQASTAVKGKFGKTFFPKTLACQTSRMLLLPGPPVFSVGAGFRNDPYVSAGTTALSSPVFGSMPCVCSI